MTREEAMARFKAAKERKRQHAMELVEFLREDYRRRTGKEAVSFEVW